MSQQVKIQNLLYRETSAGVADEVYLPLGKERTFQVTGFTSAGAGAALVNIEVSNDGENFLVLHHFDLALSNTTISDSYYCDEPWKYVRGNIASLSGVDAEITLIMGNSGY